MTTQTQYTKEVLDVVSNIQSNLKNSHHLLCYIPQLVLLLCKQYPSLSEQDRKQLFISVINSIVDNSPTIDANERAIFELLIDTVIPFFYDECVDLLNTNLGKTLKNKLFCCC